MLKSAGKSTSHLVLFDFLAPRLLSAPAHRGFTPSFSLSRASCVYRSSSSASALAAIPRSIPVHSFVDADHIAFNAELARLRSTADKPDILTTWTFYRSVEKKGLTRVLNPVYYGCVSQMVSKLCENRKAEWTDKQRQATEGLALACARAGMSDGLLCLLKRHLVRNEPDVVIRLYKSHGGPVQDLQEEVEGMVEDESDIDPTSIRFEPSQRRPFYYILAIVIAAHAMRDSFTDALAVAMKHSECRVVPQAVSHVLQELGHHDGLEAKTRAYCDSAWMAVLTQRPEAFKAHVRNLSIEGMAAKRLGSLANRLLAGFVGPYPWAAVNMSSKSASRPIVVPDKVWAYMISALIAGRQEDMAEKLWAQMLDTGIIPSVDIWNGLLEGYRKTRQTEKLSKIWEMMKKENVAFNAGSYGAKIKAMLQDGLRNVALKTFDEFKRAVPLSKDTIFVHNSVLDGFLSQDDIKAATGLLRDMTKSPIPPDIVTYNILIKYYGRKGDLRGIAGVMNQLAENGVRPDVITFTTILSAMLKEHVPNATERLLDIMKRVGVEENVATYSAIIDAQVRTGTREGIRSAWEILQMMEGMKMAQPNEITYTSFLAGIHRSRELDAEVITTVSQDIVKKMEKRGVRLKRGTYHVLFKACLDNPTQDGLKLFTDYYNVMLRKKVPFAHDTWYIILRGLTRRDEWALASELMSDMLKSGFQPMWGVLDMVMQIRRWRAGGRNGWS